MNATGSDVTIHQAEDISLYFLVPVAVCIALVTLCAIVGNFIVLLAFFKVRSKNTIYDMYIINLAVTDFLIGCFSMPIYATYVLSGYYWRFSDIFCKTYLVIDFALCLESVLMIMMLSLDRLLLLKYGMQYLIKETGKSAKVKILISWILALTLYTPAIIGWDFWNGVDVVGEHDCDVQFVHNAAFTIITGVCEFFIPLIVVCAVNYLIYKEIKRRTLEFSIMVLNSTQHYVEDEEAEGTNEQTVRRIFATRMSSCDLTDTFTISKFETQLLPHVRQRNRSTNNRDRLRDNVRAGRSLCALTLLFGLTWGPYTVSTLMIAVCSTCVNKHVYEVFNWVLWSKSAFNPILYTYNNARIKDSIKSMLIRVSKKRNTVFAAPLPGIRHSFNDRNGRHE